MNAPAILVPFKGDGYKSRLSPVLDRGERRKLAYLLLDDVLGAIRKAGLRRNCYVISSDPDAKTTARQAGVSFLSEPTSSGVNGAVRLGMRRLKGRKTFMVVPSDLALLTPSDIRQAVGLEGKASLVVIAPSSSFNGTNLLLFPRRMGSLLSYDDNSFWNHLAAAARLGLRTVVLARRGLVFDVDTPEDAEELVRLHINTGAARFLGKSLAK